MHSYRKARKTISSVILFAFLFLQILPYLPSSVQNTPLLQTLKKASLLHPTGVDAAGVSSMSATLSNPRLSFHGLANAAISAGSTFGVVKATGAGGDLDTKNLFPNDSIVITGNSPILVASTSADNATFTLKTATTTLAGANSNMTVKEEGTMKIQIFTAATIPGGGSIKISVPSPLTGPTDGIPLAELTTANSGFDSNGMTSANMACPGGFTTGTFTAGSAGAPHTYTCNTVSPVLAGVPLTIIIGNGAIGLVNPAPIQGGHTRGIADIYTVKAETWSGSSGAGSLLADGLMRVAPVDGVLVSATIDETLQFTIVGVNSSGGTYCGKAHPALGIITTATSVPWGTMGSGYVINKNEAVQQLIVTTNAANGYKVYAEENDQMGLDGNECQGSSGANADNPTAGDYTFGTGVCIRDLAGGSNNALFDWGTTPGVIYGFGYGVQNDTGSDGVGIYTSGGVYRARAFTDIENIAEDKYVAGAEIMSNIGPVSANQVSICYRINVPGTQPAGYYYNKLKYTAVAKF